MGFVAEGQRRLPNRSSRDGACAQVRDRRERARPADGLSLRAVPGEEEVPITSGDSRIERVLICADLAPSISSGPSGSCGGRAGLSAVVLGADELSAFAVSRIVCRRERFSWQGEDDACSAGRVGVEFDGSMVAFDDGAGDRESEACTERAGLRAASACRKRSKTVWRMSAGMPWPSSWMMTQAVVGVGSLTWITTRAVAWRSALSRTFRMARASCVGSPFTWAPDTCAVSKATRLVGRRALTDLGEHDVVEIDGFGSCEWGVCRVVRARAGCRRERRDVRGHRGFWCGFGSAACCRRWFAGQLRGARGCG